MRWFLFGWQRPMLVRCAAAMRVGVAALVDLGRARFM
jgi:hypothetical protein